MLTKIDNKRSCLNQLRLKSRHHRWTPQVGTALALSPCPSPAPFHTARRPRREPPCHATHPHRSSHSPVVTAAAPDTAVPGPAIPCALHPSLLRAEPPPPGECLFCAIYCQLARASHHPASYWQKINHTHTYLHTSPPSCPSSACLACLQISPRSSVSSARHPPAWNHLEPSRSSGGSGRPPHRSSAAPPSPLQAGDGGPSARHGPSSCFTRSPRPPRDGHRVRRWLWPQTWTGQSGGFGSPCPSRTLSYARWKFCSFSCF